MIVVLLVCFLLFYQPCVGTSGEQDRPGRRDNHGRTGRHGVQTPRVCSRICWQTRRQVIKKHQRFWRQSLHVWNDGIWFHMWTLHKNVNLGFHMRILHVNFRCEISVSLRKLLFRNFTFLPTICTHYVIRFKHHLFDLTFMEKTSRWITNTQVKIKSEVSSFIFSYIPTVNIGGLH